MCVCVCVCVCVCACVCVRVCVCVCVGHLYVYHIYIGLAGKLSYNSFSSRRVIASSVRRKSRELKGDSIATAAAAVQPIAKTSKVFRLARFPFGRPSDVPSTLSRDTFPL